MTSLHVLVVALAVALGTGAALPVVDDLPEVIEWEAFKLAFHRNFEAGDSDAEARRHAAFERSVDFIKEHNAEADAGVHSFRCGVNQYSDLTRDEFRALLGNQAGRGRRGLLPKVAEALANVSYGALPASVDWRTKKAVTPVKNQGSCGACWAFSVTGAVEGAYAIASGTLRSLSEQQLMDCDQQNSGCHGGNQANAFAYVTQNKGLDTEDEYNYDGGADPCWTAAEKRIAASIDSYSAVPKNDEAALAAAVAKVPVAVSIEASDAFRAYKSGVFTGASTCGKTEQSLDHAVLVVGYTASAWCAAPCAPARATCRALRLPLGRRRLAVSARNRGRPPAPRCCACAQDRQELVGRQLRRRWLYYDEAQPGCLRAAGHVRYRHRRLLCSQGPRPHL